jgi:hypothetical protein
MVLPMVDLMFVGEGQYAAEPGQEKVSDPKSKRCHPRWDPFQDYLILDTERDYQAEHAGR